MPIHTRIVCDPARPFITLPGPRGIRRYEFLLKQDENVEAVTSDEAIRTLLRERGPDGDAPIVRRQVYTFHARIADRWNTERVYLAGDAAHLSPPFAGQGMNSGLRDAHNIAWKLAAVVRGQMSKGLLSTYQDERKPHATALIELAVRLGHIMVPSSRLNAWLVQSAFQACQLIPSVQNYFAQMKYKPAPYYRSGFVSDDDSYGIVGRMLRQPVVETADGRCLLLDELLDDRFTIIAYGDDGQHLLSKIIENARLNLSEFSMIAVMPTGTLPNTDLANLQTVRETDGLLMSILPQNRSTLLLVRPDRYVAAASGSVKRFEDQLSALIRLGGDRCEDHG